MPRFPLGLIALFVLSILIYFGIGQRVLDRMRLSDKGALLVLGGMIAGSFLDIPVPLGRIDGAINIGGGLVPIGLAVYVLSRAGTSKELWRTILGIAVTGGLLYFIGGVLLKGDPRTDILDPLYIYPIVGGLTAYIISRSRRGAFIAATLGVLLVDLIHLGWLVFTGTPGRVHIGGGGAFDAIVVAGLIAVILAEIIGETRERLQGGPASKGRPEELLTGLKDLERTDEGVKPEEREGNHDEIR